ncbi:hypothetical protein WJ0W_006876 [Paenibacillus melissococcoides]|uniref:Uncharacterized protein n=1 Tax=Paenibacillus melissococcoides TaxID=2912268 RepID=A0ABM9GC14_9BACL|nr:MULTISPECIES: hypothetical protein [Paenibacillus]GIO81236.1 hypothetical protein J6TS7_48460 [Paenibacillus dendritiformis]CAH8249692.1 hypothetical protein WJ0W_006876 [Paenibacillus melissococcoides]CAH8721545.1 hypothetical protein WDD9_006346 [Paenibacillus melissococcoides]CAH8721674.1 hypothetical protein HTL2_006480 [Paenibacillus melissococcoides]
MSSSLSKTLKEQIESTDTIIRELVGSVDVSSAGNEVVIATAQGSALDAYGDMLAVHERELVEELRRLVLEYSAKIAANRQLQRAIGREAERREIIKERIKAGEHI